MHKKLIWDPVQYSNYYRTQPSHAPVSKAKYQAKSKLKVWSENIKKALTEMEKTICIMGASWKTKK
jgi:hypothetical protein